MLKNEPSTSAASDQKIFKFIIVGDSGVGKTCLTHRFCHRKVLTTTDATIGVDFQEREIRILNEIVKVQLWDTAGQERFRQSMTQHYYRNVNAIVFVYDMTNHGTFKNIPSWVIDCSKRGLGKDIPKALVASHYDNQERRLVSTAKGQKLAERFNMTFIETSPKMESETQTIDDIFKTLATKLIFSPYKAPPEDNQAEAERSIILRSPRSEPIQKRKCC